ncbi:MAG: ABC transporter substrate-binding protein, partial [Deltaproteobacteria bacterium]|nr:ABC transporter substrate-binding protein [Deltaproteobacteria bacterium]
MSKRRKVMPLIIVGFLLLFAAGIALAGEPGGDIQSWDWNPHGIKPTGEVGEPIKIAAINSITGMFAPIGLAEVHCNEIWVDEVNAGGGLLVSGVRHPIKLFIYDGGTMDPIKSRTAAERAINQDKVRFIIGPIDDDGGAAVQKVAEPNKVIHIYFAYSADLVAPPHWYTFHGYVTPREFSPSIYQWFAENRKDIKTIFILSTNDDLGVLTADLAEKAARDNGFEILGRELYPWDASDFYPLVSKALAKNPDMIDLPVSGEPQAGGIAKAARELGFKGAILTECEKDVVALAQIGGEAVEGMYWQGGGVDEAIVTPRMKKFMADYAARYGQWNGNAALHVYNMPFLLKSIQLAGTIDDP